jgi:hypothetical protein
MPALLCLQGPGLMHHQLQPVLHLPAPTALQRGPLYQGPPGHHRLCIQVSQSQTPRVMPGGTRGLLS